MNNTKAPIIYPTLGLELFGIPYPIDDLLTSTFTKTSTNNTKVPIIYPTQPNTGSGTLRYPIDDLLTSARSILKAQADHYLALCEAADAAGDEDEELKQSDNFWYVSNCIFAIDKKYWYARRAELTKSESGRKWTDLGPRASEKSLLRLSGPVPEWVFKAAIQRRKNSREEPSTEDPTWEKEDALFDLLQLIIKNEGLFVVPTESQPT